MKAFNFKKQKRLIPGFGLSLGITLTMLSMVVLIPLGCLIWKGTQLSFSSFWQTITDARVLSSYKVSFICAAVAAFINGVFGIILAWVFVRYSFPFSQFFNALIEIPFALPTSIAGIALTRLYATKGWLGSFFYNWFGVKISYTWAGIIIAMVFVGIPFVVRTVQPVLEQIDTSDEEAAQLLGASKIGIFWKIIFPKILPAALTGFGLSFARVLGEYGSVIFIAGNMPYKTETVPLIIMSKLEQFNYEQAIAIALVILLISFIIFFGINTAQVAFTKTAK